MLYSLSMIKLFNQVKSSQFEVEEIFLPVF